MQGTTENWLVVRIRPPGLKNCFLPRNRLFTTKSASSAFRKKPAEAQLSRLQYYYSQSETKCPAFCVRVYLVNSMHTVAHTRVHEYARAELGRDPNQRRHVIRAPVRSAQQHDECVSGVVLA